MSNLSQQVIDKTVTIVKELLESEPLNGCVIVMGRACEGSTGVTLIHEGKTGVVEFLGCQQILISKLMEASQVVGISSKQDIKTLPPDFVIKPH